MRDRGETGDPARRGPRRWPALVLPLVAALAVVGAVACGDDDNDDGAGATATPSADMDMSGPGMAVAGDIHVHSARARASTGETSAVYLMLRSFGGADRLVAAATDVAGRVEIHKTTTEGSTSKMEKVDGVDIPAGGEVMLAPGGIHVMLMGLKQPLAVGDRITVKLTFEKGGETTVDVPVEEIGAGGMDHGSMASPTAKP